MLCKFLVGWTGRIALQMLTTKSCRLAPGYQARMGKVQGQQGKDSKLQARHCFWVVLMVLMATKGAQRAEVIGSC